MGRLPLDPKDIITVMRLLRNVRLNDLVRDVTAPAAKVAPGPDMTVPKSPAEVGKFGQEAIGSYGLSCAGSSD